MKILQICHSFNPCFAAGGVVSVTYSLCKKLVERGHNVVVFTTDGCTKRLDVKTNYPVNLDGIIVYYFRNLSNYLRVKMKMATPYYLFKIAPRIKNFDIIHMHEHRTMLAVIVYYYAKKYKIPYIVQAHGSVLPFLQKEKFKKIFDIFFGNNILKNASYLIAVSNTEVKQYKQIGIPDNKIIIIPNGIEIESFTNLPEKGIFRKMFGIYEKHIILYFGRLHERKGIDFLIRSYAKLLNEIKDVVLVLAGPDDGYLDQARLLVDELHLNNYVRFTGFIDNADKLTAYVDSDVLIYPAIFEIFGLVPFEAIMCGIPVIVTDDCGCGEIIKEAECGYLVHYRDVTGLSEALRSILEHPDVNRRMVDAGRRYIEEHLEWGSVVKRVEDMYEDCVRHV